MAPTPEEDAASDGDRTTCERTSVTVAICTYNRCELLGRTLASLAELRVPDGVSWEVVVVDNRCTDETPAVVASFTDELPVRRVEEPRPGLSHARNRAVEAARGELVVWTDDDVLVSSDWLATYTRAFRRWPDAAFFGGPIRPLFLEDRPDWLAEGWDVVRGAYPVRDRDDEPFEIGDRRDLPYGANFAAPAEILADRDFDPRLGRSGSDLMGGEETEYLARLLEEDHTGRWVPGADLEHMITPERLTLAYLRQYYRDLGRLAEARRRRDGGGDVPLLLGRPRWAWRSALEAELRYRLGRLTSEPRDWLADLREASRAQGILMGPPGAADERREEDGPW